MATIDIYLPDSAQKNHAGEFKVSEIKFDGRKIGLRIEYDGESNNKRLDHGWIWLQPSLITKMIAEVTRYAATAEWKLQELGIDINKDQQA